MKQKVVLLLISVLAITFVNAQSKALPNVKPFVNMITKEGLDASLHFITSDYFEGRGAGTAGEKLAAEYLASCYQWMDIAPLKKSTTDKNPLKNYFQEFKFDRGGKTVNSQNVIAFIEGSDPLLKNEAIIISAHYDHLGRDTSLTGDQVFNGAADDGSGTVALLHIAKSFAEAKKKGQGPRRSVIFLHAGSEEAGMQGSFYYAAYSPLWPLEKTAAEINMDGVGGLDITRLNGNKNYVYLLKVDSTSNHLYEKVKLLNTKSGINLDIKYPANPGDFSSDNNAFEAQLIPSLYFSTGLTEHYHKVTDEASAIDYEHMTKIVKLVFITSWEFANAPVVSTFNRNHYVKTGKYFCKPCGCKHDEILFDGPGPCSSCKMELLPIWKRK
jgi:Peptidase family M28